MRATSCLAAVAFLAASLTLAASANAAIIFSDDFNGPAGPLAGTTPDVGTGNWTATTAAATPMQLSGSGAVIVGTSGQDDYAAFTSPALTTGAFVKTTLNLTVTAAAATGDYFAHLSTPVGTTTTFVQRLFARSSGAGFQFGLVDTSGTGSTTTWGTTVLNLNQAYKVDVTWNFVAGTNNDTFSVLVNDAAYLTHAWTSATAEPANLAAANLRQGTAGSAPNVSVDSYVVDSVVPEPTSLALDAASLVGLVGVSRRRS